MESTNQLTEFTMIKEMIRTEVNTALEMAREIHPHMVFNTPIIKYSNRMTRTAGSCSFRDLNLDNNCVFTLTFSNPIIRNNEIDSFIRQVVYHEVAHMIDKIVYNGWGHGNSFNHVMRNVLQRTATESTRYHRFKTQPKKRLARKFKYECKRCSEEFNLTQIRHNRAINGANYSHECFDGVRGHIKFVG